MSGRKLVYIFAYLCIVSLGLNAQSFPQDNWYIGRVTLKDGQEKEGIIKYDLEANAIQLKIDEKFETYHANQFITFTILMKQEEVYRSFYVLPHANTAGYKRPTVFELITEGEVSLLAREYIATRNTSPNSGFYGSRWASNPYSPTIAQRYLAFRLFLVDKRGNITALNTNKRDVIASFGDHQKDLKKFVKSNKIKTDRVMDMAELVEYYNGLSS